MRREVGTGPFSWGDENGGRMQHNGQKWKNIRCYVGNKDCTHRSTHLGTHQRTHPARFSMFFERFLRIFTNRKYKKNQPIFNDLSLNIGWFGGVREIWTLAAVSHPTPLAGAPLRPLEYYSTSQSDIKYSLVITKWRRGWDSNPWSARANRWFSRPVP